jgi:hypothetical protein
MTDAAGGLGWRPSGHGPGTNHRPAGWHTPTTVRLTDPAPTNHPAIRVVVIRVSPLRPSLSAPTARCPATGSARRVRLAPCHSSAPTSGLAATKLSLLGRSYSCWLASSYPPAAAQANQLESPIVDAGFRWNSGSARKLPVARSSRVGDDPVS